MMYLENIITCIRGCKNPLIGPVSSFEKHYLAGGTKYPWVAARKRWNNYLFWRATSPYFM